jgi:hypothetical protein
VPAGGEIKASISRRKRARGKDGWGTMQGAWRQGDGGGFGRRQETLDSMLVSRGGSGQGDESTCRLGWPVGLRWHMSVKLQAYNIF